MVCTGTLRHRWAPPLGQAPILGFRNLFSARKSPQQSRGSADTNKTRRQKPLLLVPKVSIVMLQCTGCHRGIFLRFRYRGSAGGPDNADVNHSGGTWGRCGTQEGPSCNPSSALDGPGQTALLGQHCGREEAAWAPVPTPPPAFLQATSAPGPYVPGSHPHAHSKGSGQTFCCFFPPVQELSCPACFSLRVTTVLEVQY